MPKQTQNRIMQMLVGTVISVALGLATWGLTQNVALGKDVAVLQSKQEDTKDDLTEIKGDIKEILRRLPNASP